MWDSADVKEMNFRGKIDSIDECLFNFFNYSTDVSGGESPSMLVAIRDCVKASNVISFGKSEEFTALTYEEAFFLATLGGSQGDSCIIKSPSSFSFLFFSVLFNDTPIAKPKILVRIFHVFPRGEFTVIEDFSRIVKRA